MIRRQARGFTLVELMVATGLMMVLGLMLIASVNTSITIVSTGSSRGEAWVHAQSILARVEDDLSQVHADARDGRLTSGKDPLGRPFIVFTRALPEERVYAAGIFAAQAPNDPSRRVADTRTWRGRSGADNYRAMGGYAAVAYVFEPYPESTTLYRAIMAPVGRSRVEGIKNSARGPVSADNDLFDDLQTWHLSGNKNAAPYPAALNFGATFEHFASDVLYLGVEFLDPELERASGKQVWRQHWESKARADLPGVLANSRNWPALARSRGLDNSIEKSAGSVRDGIRTVLPQAENDAIYWQLPQRLGMGFPSHARITVTVAYGAPLDAMTTLAAEISESETTIQLLDGGRFRQHLDLQQNLVQIGSEWIRFGALAGNTLTECTRGLRGTTPSAHSRDERVTQGLSLSKLVRMPQG